MDIAVRRLISLQTEKDNVKIVFVIKEVTTDELHSAQI